MKRTAKKRTKVFRTLIRLIGGKTAQDDSHNPKNPERGNGTT